MLVKEIMTKNPDAITKQTTLKQAALEMQKFDFGFLPIKEDGKIIGVLTDRDIVIRGIAAGLDPTKTTVEDVMTNDLFFCNENDDLNQIAKLMSEKQVNRVAVYTQGNEFAGVVSIGDIARKCNDPELCGKITEAIHEK